DLPGDDDAGIARARVAFEFAIREDLAHLGDLDADARRILDIAAEMPGARGMQPDRALGIDEEIGHDVRIAARAQRREMRELCARQQLARAGFRHFLVLAADGSFAHRSARSYSASASSIASAAASQRASASPRAAASDACSRSSPATSAAPA